MNTFLRKIYTHLFLIVYNPSVLMFFYLKKTKKITDIRTEQLIDLKKTLIFSYENVPFYKKWFDDNEFNPYLFEKLTDLERLPILNKSIIKENINDFRSLNKNYGAKLVTTGGSTGEPFKYLTSKKSRKLSFALLLNGWALGGYRIGDTVAVLAGGSLVANSKESKISRIKNGLLNIHKFSTYGVGEDDLYDYYKKINKLNPRFIRGYASALYLFAEYLQKNNLKLNGNITATFTTAEMLNPKQRLLIEKVFNTKVYDGYGLNDGGLTAFECARHKGYHIDTERGYLEVVNDKRELVVEQEGRILATTLMEKCMPLIRYDTGDLGVLGHLACPCCNPKPILKELKGRITDFLEINNKVISSPVLTVLMGKTSVINYQIEQTSKNSIIVKLVYSDNSKILEDRNFITESLKSNLGEFNLKFEYLDEIVVNNGAKHKFIVSYLG